MKVAIIKYNAGNVVSVANALRRHGVEPTITDDRKVIASADKVIFPGVGEASSAMNFLRQKRLDAVIKNLNQPVLAICLGMQLLTEHSEENETRCLGVVAGQTKLFAPSKLKVPHIGWNNLTDLRSPIFQGVTEGSRVYFVHSYFVPAGENTISQTDYGTNFSSAICRGNYYGVQFHPEKSGPIGARIIENFLGLE